MPEQLRVSQEELEMIEDYAACNYSPQQIAKVMGYEKEDFMASWKNPDHLIRHHYDKGQLEAEFVINHKALETAKAGNLTAMQIWEKNRERVRVENIKSQILFGCQNTEDEHE